MSNLITFKKFLSESIIKKTKLAYHDILNPKLWDDDKLKDTVDKRLKEIAEIFIDSLDIDNKLVTDIVFTGSSTNYNYSDLSDIDLHISIDYSKIKGKIKPEDYFSAMKTNWNLSHDIKIYGHDVEIYVNDKKENLVGDSAAYSLKNSKWIKEPKKDDPKYNQGMIKAKASHFAVLIDKQINLHHNDKEELQKLNDKIGKYRKIGLTKKGEFSLENLVFKTLRNNGYVDKLRKQINKAEDSKLNLENLYIKGDI